MILRSGRKVRLLGLVVTACGSNPLFVALQYSITLTGAEGVAFCCGEVALHHVGDQLRKGYLWLPAELVVRFARIIEQLSWIIPGFGAGCDSGSADAAVVLRRRSAASARPGRGWTIVAMVVVMVAACRGGAAAPTGVRFRVRSRRRCAARG